MIDVAIDISCIYGSNAQDAAAAGPGAPAASPAGATPTTTTEEEEAAGDTLAFDDHSACSIQLANGCTLWLWSVGEYLALVAVSPDDEGGEGNSRLQPGLVDCNVATFRKALHDIMQVSQNRESATPGAWSSESKR